MSEASHDESKWWTWVLRTGTESDPDKKLAIFEQALQRLPNSPELHGGYADFLADRWPDDDRAEAMYERALELQPDDAGFIRNYADFLAAHQQDYDRAEAMYRRALELEPDDAGFIGNYGNFLAEKKQDYDRAEAMYERALELQPDDALIIRNYAYFLAALRRDYDRAEAMYERALELDPDDALIPGNYAEFLAAQRQDYDRAETMYERALELNPDDANVNVNLGYLLLVNGRREALEQVVGCIRKAVQLSHCMPSQTLAEALFYDCLRFELAANSVGKSVGRLKALFEEGYERGIWDFSAFFDRHLSELPEERRDFYVALGAAVLDVAKVIELEKFTLWDKIESIDPYTI
ncbi:MAG: hypothetical protein DRQ52_09820 [Gammaproteobacteria bacterium]|nr:MAG: hypothetical protein DRQ52_09820 [Gammaproteobacteria bacterium]RLA40114.1 MAG: hypothetical protein DRR42_26385 [Gammaproteobacteria bacterium]